MLDDTAHKIVRFLRLVTGRGRPITRIRFHHSYGEGLMSIRTLVLCSVLAGSFVTALSAHAQVDMSPVIPAPKGPHLASPDTANPAYPLRVWIRINHNRWDGYAGYYHALGTFTVDPAASVVYNFNYECPVSFYDRPDTHYQARWIKPGKKLQVLLYDSQSNKNRTCSLLTMKHPPINAQITPVGSMRNPNY